MNAGLDENEAELAVLVLAVALQMLADGDGLDRPKMLVCSRCFTVDAGVMDSVVYKPS